MPRESLDLAQVRAKYGETWNVSESSPDARDRTHFYGSRRSTLPPGVGMYRVFPTVHGESPEQLAAVLSEQEAHEEHARMLGYL
ncbi:hypothetical protein [Actinocorallia aurea]